ncbi:MAG: response regulator [Sediminibacterium sp.]|nr:response regulator [Sediminibacterium sp.]MDP3128036.1 response regulator [Sediminibacterium sp.]
MNQSIKAKLFTGFSVIVLILITVAFFMTNKLAETNSRLENLVDVSSKKVSLSHEILIDVLNVGRQEKNIILEKDIFKMELYRSNMNKVLSALDKKISEFRELADEIGIKDISEFKTLWDEYKISLDEIVLLAMKNENDKAFEISGTKGFKTRENATILMERIITRNENRMAEDKRISDENYKSSLNLIIVLIIAGLIILMIIAYWIVRGITKRISFIAKEAEKIASREFAGDKPEDKTKDELEPVFNSLINISESFREVTENANSVASGDYTVDFTPRSDRDTLGNALKKMTGSLRETTAANEKHNWLTAGQNQLNEKLIGDQSIEELATNTISFLCAYLKANIGAVYLFNDEDKALVLNGQYAFVSPEDTKEKFALNEGLIGQAAREQKQISLRDITEEQIRITSSVLNAKPKHLLITPFLFEGKTLGVIEVGRLTDFSETEKEFINASMESIAISVNSAIARKQIQELLEETKAQSEELQMQQEELKQTNEELEEQTQNLKQQQEELQMTNEELEEQTQSLEMKNKEVEAAKYDIEQKTKQLEISSRYKSEFLSNMSHELRTPLNSLLILSKDLSENRKKNLDNDQVESAGIIYKSGHDLLVLINEVLDLSKIEAGKMSINIERVSLRNLTDELIRNFKHHAEQKGLKLTSKLDKELPESIRTDSQRLNQILKNLLSNAIKFTEKGSVNISINRYTESMVIISVTDTGIGIQEDKQMAIFEAFQQADGGTSRKYGGTGLGLSISRELAKLLGAEIKLSSKPNEGATFSVIIPLEIHHEYEPAGTNTLKETVLYKPHAGNGAKYLNYPSIEDDRDSITRDDKVVLIIEDDLKFASTLLKQANKKGFKCLSVATGEDGLLFAAKYKPQAIILDMELPGINGHNVLLELKANPSVRHIPVHIISANERSLEPIKEGAIEYLMKPVDKKDLEEAFNRIENFVNRKMKNLLIIEDDENSRKAMRKLIGNGDVKCFEAGTGKEALDVYQQYHIDCIVLDIGLPDMSGFDLIYKLENLKGHNIPPIIIYTGKELTKEENNELQKYAESIIIKGVKSEERLLDETALFLHRTISNLPESKQVIINNLYDKEAIFHSKKILLVDDDMRNVFALSKILKERGMEIVKAENGKNALEMLDTHSDIDLVLMDIMMPEMDGYEAMKRIRSQRKFKNLPVIALTAKAMNDDKQKCIDAGANDYIAKPVDVERLLSLMRVWLSK